MSSKDMHQWKDYDNDVEENRRPERSNPPSPVVSEELFEAGAVVSVENERAPKRRIYKSRPQKQHAPSPNKENDGKPQAFGADEAPGEGLSVRTTSASTTTHRTRMTTTTDSSHATTEPSPVPFPPEEGTTEPGRLDEEEHHAFPSAERVGGYGGAGHASIPSDDVKLSQEQQGKKRQKLIAGGIGLFLVAVMVGIISLFLVERGDGATSNPTAAPTSTQSHNSQLEGWISSIQSRMPSTTFDDSTSPQSWALDWMLQDDYTKLLNEDYRIIQRFALAVLYISCWDKDTLDGWLLSTTECDWGVHSNVDCTARDVVREVNLWYYGLSGTIQREIGLLTALAHLDLGDNSLKGTIPSEFGLLSTLTFLNLHYNILQGTIPSEFALLTELTELDLSLNYLEGAIPSELGLLSALTAIDLSPNDLEGTIPSEIGLLTDLTSLLLSSNNLEGTIPTEIGLLTDLTSLYLSSNNLEGTIPTEIGLLTELASLYLDNNDLSGLLPTELANLSNLGWLFFYNTTLSGSIPFNLCGNLKGAEIDCGLIQCDCCTDAKDTPC